MAPDHFCLKEQDWGKLWEIVKQLSAHMIEGEKSGGHRDRLFAVEIKINDLNQTISTIKKGYWKACIVSALVGGLLARATPDIITELFKFIIKIFSK